MPMPLCFEFTDKADGQMHDLQDGKSMFNLCGQLRDEGQAGFLVRAPNVEEARNRLDSLPPVHKNVETVFIL